MQALDQHFYTSFATRILIYAMAAASLNLVLGYGGMVSFGHAAFFGAGAYIVGILAVEGVSSLDLLAARDRGRGARRARDRRDLAAHARGVLHHDHARLRADDVLRVRLAEGLRRRRRRFAPGAPPASA